MVDYAQKTMVLIEIYYSESSFFVKDVPTDLSLSAIQDNYRVKSCMVNTPTDGTTSTICNNGIMI